MGWYLKALKSYATFAGRARRREFWIFALVSAFLSVVLTTVDTVLAAGSNAGYGPLSALYWLVILVPSLAVAVRRLHDTGRSGRWLLLLAIPILGWAVLGVFWVRESEVGANRYGPDPKATGAQSLPVPGGLDPDTGGPHLPSKTTSPETSTMSRLQPGDNTSRSLTLTADHVATFAELTGDYNPLHFDEEFAARTRFGRLVVQGGLTTGLLHALVAMDLPGPGTVFLSQDWKFTAPVFVGDTITAHAEVVSVHDTKPVTQLAVRVERQDGETVLEGEAWCYRFTPDDA